MARTYTDNETGETLTEEEIARRYIERVRNDSSRFPWRKIYPANWVSLPGILQSPAYCVFNEVVIGCSSATNRYTGTFDQIRDRAGVSRYTVSKVMDGLQRHDIIRKELDGLYMVNPRIVYAGSEGKEIVFEKQYFEMNKKPFERSLPPRESSEFADRIESIIAGGDTNENTNRR